MKIFNAVVLSLVMMSSASAGNLTNVKILEIKTSKDVVELKLRPSYGPQDSYFFVSIVKSDADAFEKLALVAKKLEKGEAFQLDLMIRSFSLSPSGSSYRSESVTFAGDSVRN